MPDTPQADKPESVNETIDRLRPQYPPAHPAGCTCRGCSRTDLDGI